MPFSAGKFEHKNSRQQRIFSDTITLEEGLQESAGWYLANEAAVNKNPYIAYIDDHLL